MDKDRMYEIASKYVVENNSKFSKQGTSDGGNTKECILKEIKKQSENNNGSE